MILWIAACTKEAPPRHSHSVEDSGTGAETGFAATGSTATTGTVESTGMTGATGATGDTGLDTGWPTPPATEWEADDDNRLGAGVAFAIDGAVTIAMGQPSGWGLDYHVIAQVTVVGPVLDGVFRGSDTKIRSPVSTDSTIGSNVLAPGDVTGDGQADLVVFDYSDLYGIFWPLGAGAFVLGGPLDQRGVLYTDPNTIAVGWPTGPWRGTGCGDLDLDGHRHRHRVRPGRRRGPAGSHLVGGAARLRCIRGGV